MSANDPHPFDSTRQSWSSPYSAGGREHQGVLKVEGAVNEFHRAVAQGGGRLIEHRSREDLIIFVNYETRHSHRIRPVEFMNHDGNNEMIISHYAGRIMTPPDKLPLRAWWGSLHGEGRDAIVYLVAFVFSLGMGMLSKEPAQWHWGFISAGTYAVAMTYSLLSGGTKRVPSHRTILAALVFLGAVVVPLGLEVQWRHVDGTQQFAQPEVWVIEQSGEHVVVDGGPYVAFFSHGVLHGRVTGEPQYQAFFPYFPLMSVFGLPRALSPGQSQLTDARVVMSMATIVVMGLGLWFSRISRAKKLLVAQALCILPTGALFLSTGGDDMPILALGFFISRCSRAASTAAARGGVWNSRVDETHGLAPGVCGPPHVRHYPRASCGERRVGGNHHNFFGDIATVFRKVPARLLGKRLCLSARPRGCGFARRESFAGPFDNECVASDETYSAGNRGACGLLSASSLPPSFAHHQRVANSQHRGGGSARGHRNRIGNAYGLFDLPD